MVFLMDLDEEIVQELRWDPILKEWVIVSNIREKRPWHPKDYCPFCPGYKEVGEYLSAIVIPNKYPALSTNPPKPTFHNFYVTASAIGECKVVIETPRHDIEDIDELELDEIYEFLLILRKEMVNAMNKPWAKYFLFFRNKGREIGVSLLHPHSQIYVLPFIPAKIEREIISFHEYWSGNKKCLLCSIINVEKSDRIRLIYENNYWISFLPFYAHWPYEVHIVPKRHVALYTELNDKELYELSDVLKIIIKSMNKMFKKSMPYVLVLHQAPIHGKYDYYHLHIEIYGMLRETGTLKYTAGIEHGGGNFTYDGVPEEHAKQLKDKCKEASKEFKPHGICIE